MINKHFWKRSAFYFGKICRLPGLSVVGPTAPTLGAGFRAGAVDYAGLGVLRTLAPRSCIGICRNIIAALICS